MNVISPGLPAVGPVATGPPQGGTTRKTGDQDHTLVSAFYPFATVSITETRRQVEQAQAFNEQQAARRGKEREEARDASSQEEVVFRGIAEDRLASDEEVEDVAVTTTASDPLAASDPPTVGPESEAPDLDPGAAGLDLFA